MRVSQIKNGTVSEIHEINRPIADFPGVGYIEAAPDVAVGFTYDGSGFTPPAGYADDILAAKRAGVALSRSQFIQAVYAAGIMNKGQAIAASAGQVPAFFLTALEGLVAAQAMSQAEADNAEILWAGLTQVERNHPLIPIAQGALGLTDAQVDALFGIV